MRRPHALLAALAVPLFSVCTGAQPLPVRTVLDEQFNDLARWKDISTATLWTGAPANGSAFETVDGVVSLNQAAIVAGGGYFGATDLRTFSAIDFQFPRPIDRREAAVTVEFRVRWEKLLGSSAEGNRLMMALNHSYPEGGLDLTPNLRASDYSQAWWARPAYNVRIRGGTSFEASAIVMYGGGNSALGEYESAGTAPNRWWLPGFIAAPLGVSPGSGVSWPNQGWSDSALGLASVSWQRFRFTVSPTAISLSLNNSDDGQTWLTAVSQPTPRQGQQPTTAPLYTYFPTLEGLRLYWRNSGGTANSPDVHIDWLKITVAPADTPINRWLLAAFGSDALGNADAEATAWGDFADPDADGRPNLLERWLGSGPLAPDQRTALTLVPRTGGGWAVRYRRVKDTTGLRAVLESSADLRMWAAVNTTATVITSGTETDEVEQPLDATNPAVRYLRLAVARD